MLPQNIQALTNQLPVTNDSFTMETRIGRADEPPPFQAINDENTCLSMLESWNAFHSELPYETFEQFYSKEHLCEDIAQLRISQNTFIQLICDRAFLFLQYAENLKDPTYPTLREAYQNPETMSESCSEEKTELVRRQGFVPTDELASEWREWKSNMDSLNRAIALRKAHMKRGNEIQAVSPIKLETTEFICTQLEEKLAQLFCAYLSAMADTAYRYEFKPMLNNAQGNALPWIHAISGYRVSSSETAPCTALLLWVLFTAQTTKLAKGELNTYKFRISPSKRDMNQADVRPEKLNGNQSQKIRCDIILFDHLLDLLPPPDREYAKFQFYVLTRYDRFTHYRTKAEKHMEFNCEPDSMDGIDQLGCMIRYHIEHCLMNTPAWLTLGVPSLTSKPLMNSLSALLLYDATLLPVKRRLTERVRYFLESSKGAKSIEEYKQCAGDEVRITKMLNRLREENNLHFQTAHVFMDKDVLNDPNIKQCERFTVEHALKERAFKDYYDNLRNKAEELFPAEWFLSRRIFRD